MYKVSDATKNAYKSDASVKSIEVRIPGANITLTNEDILADSLELKEAIESSDNLSFQGCIASSFKIDCFNLVDETLEGEWIECDIKADNTTTIPLFKGYITEVTNTTHEEFVTQIRAYDALYNICKADVTSWYNGLTFPITCKNMRNSFFSHFGITQASGSLPNDGFSIDKTIEDKVIVGEKIIKAICQLNGRFGRIGRTGKFEYVHLVVGTEALYPAEDLFPKNTIYPADENAIDNVSKAYYTSISFENYRVSSITKVQFINKEGRRITTYGSGTNVFTVKDNPLIWGKKSAELSAAIVNLYNSIRGLWYTPSEVSCVGLPYVECGDFVLMSARRSLVRAYVLSRTLKGIQILEDSYSAPGDKTLPKYVPDIQTQANANAAAITTEVSRATTAESGLNTSISTEVSRAKTAESGLNTKIANEATRITNEATTRANQISAVNVRCDSLDAKDAQIENLVATKASISQLNATNANINSLSARTASVERLVATKASISQLNATNANIANLNARTANVESLVAQKVDAEWVRANTVTADKITTAVNSAMQGTVTVGTLRAGSIYIYDGSGYESLNSYVRRYAH